MIKSVIFDMDGLMFDTEQIHSKAWRFACEFSGIDIHPGMLNEMRGVSSKGCKEIFYKYNNQDIDYDRVHEIYVAWYNGWVTGHGVPIKPGLTELLNFLKENKFKIGLATSTRCAFATKFLKNAKVDSFFNAFVFGDMVQNGKPNPDIFLKAAKFLETDPSSCLVLEDSAAGITAAYNAGCHVIHVPDLCIVPRKVLSYTDAICKSLFEVKTKLENGFLA